MVDDHLIFLVTIPIHDGSNEGSEKDVFGSERSSERSSETTTISSETDVTSSGTDVTSSGTRQKTSEKIIELINADPQILPLDI